MDSTTLTDDYELGVTYISLNFFNELYEKQHLLRLNLSSQEPKPKLDASVATDLGVTVLSEEDFRKLHCQIEQLKAEIIKHDTVGEGEEKRAHDGDVANDNSAFERMTKDVNESGRKDNRHESPNLTGTATSSACVAAAGNAPSRHSSVKAIAKDYVHSRVGFFENLNRSQVICSECPTQASNQDLIVHEINVAKQPNDESIADEVIINYF